MSDLKNTKKRFAVVTGASSGIGFELAKIFAKNNFDLLLCSNSEKIIAAAEALRKQNVSVDFLQADLASFDGVEKLYSKIKSSGLPVDAIAMNAGVGVSGEFIDTDLQREMNLIQLNIVSLVHLTKRLLPDFVAQGHGRILYTSSLAAEMPGPYYAVYAASKAFVQSFAEAIRAEVKDKGVTITALQPGATETNFFERANMMETKAGAGSKDSAADVAKDGFEALMAGKDHVVAGSFINTLQAVAGKFMPETVGAKMQGQSTRPKTAQH